MAAAACARGDFRCIGRADNWLRHVQDVREQHEALIESVSDDDTRIDAAVRAQRKVRQVRDVRHTTIVQDALAARPAE